GEYSTTIKCSLKQIRGVRERERKRKKINFKTHKNEMNLIFLNEIEKPFASCKLKKK
ncbi:hypothetical protein DOY81_007262, partial [Sarcophaga bullata]